MFLSFYNPEHVGDTLLLLCGETSEPVATETKGRITRVYHEATGETLAYNVFRVSEVLALTQTGHIVLDEAQEAALQAVFEEAGFTPVQLQRTANFVVGEVLTCEAHPDSDHLHVTTVADGTTTLHIVCGAQNVAAGQRVVVARHGSVMPDGQLIWRGELRGVASEGMLCSARELGIEQVAMKRGILVLDERYTVGQAFERETYHGAR